MSVSLRLAKSFNWRAYARGDINTYAVFAELGSRAIGPHARAGLILPTGIATDDTTKFFFGDLVQKGRLADLVGFENEENIFPAVHHFTKFCRLTIGGSDVRVLRVRLAFYIRRFSQLQEEQRFFELEARDFELLNPNTGNCPVFRTARDAELTKAIYRRVPVLLTEAKQGRDESNPWLVSFKRLFDMSNDSDHFRTSDELKAEGCRLEGNVWRSEDRTYLPLYEAKMLHQFDHRFSTYEGATQEQLNVGILPQPTSAQKRDPSFVVRPRYWVDKELVDAAIPRFPEPLAAAVATRSGPSIQHVLRVWAAGYLVNHGQTEEAQEQLAFAALLEVDDSVRKRLDEFGGQLIEAGTALDRLYPLSKPVVARIAEAIHEPEGVALELLDRFKPKWLMGWRNITNTTNERTVIAAATPLSAFGHAFLLIFSRIAATERLCLLAALNSMSLDFVARQKFGGTNLAYHVFRQLTVLPPASLRATLCWNRSISAAAWIRCRCIELVFVAQELSPLGGEFDGLVEPFIWDDERRFQIRCELDAAFFHLYLPGHADATWKPARVADGNVVDETPEHLAALTRHFPTPRHAVSHIFDTFPLVKKKDEEAHGRYRTKDRILEIYDEMLEAQRAGREWTSPLNPPPGVRQ